MLMEEDVTYVSLHPTQRVVQVSELTPVKMEASCNEEVAAFARGHVHTCRQTTNARAASYHSGCG